MPTRERRGVSGWARAAALVAALLPAAAIAQAPDADDPWAAGRAAYADEDFDNAARFIVEAIHREPDNPAYYLGLARTEYWRGNFERAVYYYDLYLGELSDHISPNVRSADRLDRVRSERESANAEREDPNAPVLPPPGPDSAYQALTQRLAEGPILTTTGGGALALYRGMLRAGYAHPDLIAIRTRLANALLDEAAAAVADDVPAIPRLSLVEWQTQRGRFEGWMELVPRPAETGPRTDIPVEALDPTVLQVVDPWTRAEAHIALCDAQIQALNQNYVQAAEGFRVALTTMPDLVPAHMGRLNALHRLGNAATAVEAELATFEAVLRSRAPARVGVAAVYRAAFASQAGDAEGATALLSELLGIPPTPPR